MELKDWIQKDMSRFIRRHEPKTKVNVPIRHEQATLLSTRDYEQQIRMSLTHNRFNHACELFNELKQAFLSLPIDHQEERRQYYRLLQLTYKEIYDYVADKHKTSRILEEISGSDNVFGTAQTGPRATSPRTSVEDSMMRHAPSLSNLPEQSPPTANATTSNEPLADISSMIDAAANGAPDDALSLVRPEQAPLPPPPSAGSEQSESPTPSEQSTPSLPPLPQSIIDSGLGDDESVDAGQSEATPSTPPMPEEKPSTSEPVPQNLTEQQPQQGVDEQANTPVLPVAQDGIPAGAPQEPVQESKQNHSLSNVSQPEQTLPPASDEGADIQQDVIPETPQPPVSTDAVQAEGSVDSDVDELTRAREAFKQASLSPGPRIIRKAAPPQEPEQAPAAQGFSSLYVRGVQAMHAKDYKTAAQLFLRRVQENPNDRASRIRLTECLEVLDGTITR